MSKPSFSSLPPSKRFKLAHAAAADLPAKKRIAADDLPSILQSPAYCLPMKKRVLALPQSPEKAEEDGDDDVSCSVCRGTDGHAADPIVFCDGCDLMVHASCYGNPLVRSIPEGDWFCERCREVDAAGSIRCCLCPVEGGALKRTTSGGWAHVACALLVPEVFFTDPVGRDGVDLSRVPVRRWGISCCLCGSSEGCAVECSEYRCGLGFHVMCGVEEGLCLEYREGKGGGIVVGFCREHTRLWNQQERSGKFTFVPRGDRKRKHR